ncbi:MAG TPA: prepilin-type N-terminal cleavage/methylation domain-containing protein [Steroidobacteraceae bacterium]|jgi:type IV pilus assembly protein PilW|nr:prepilin-type N-terminal cleavage/methylation domain-containing protein [Steroidobacteraceae bacterium]
MSTITPTAAQRRARCRGFTLVEMLIAILIALFLLGGVMTIVQDTRRATSSQVQSTQLQDSVRLAMSMLSAIIQTAGYYADPYDYPPDNIYSLAAAAPFVAGQAVSGTGAFAAAAPGDTISVRYQTNNADGILNCAGTSNTTGVPTLYVNTFSLDNQGQLQCALTSGGVAAAPIVLIPAITTGPNQLKITNLQIQYGVQTNPTPAGQCLTSIPTANQCADAYLDAAQVSGKTINGQTAWNYVVSVRVTLSFLNPLGGPDLKFTRVIGIMNRMGVVSCAGICT